MYTALPDVMRYKNPTPNPLQYQKFILFFPLQRGGLRGVQGANEVSHKSGNLCKWRGEALKIPF